MKVVDFTFNGAVIAYAGIDYDIRGNIRDYVYDSWVYQDGYWWVGGRLSDATRHLTTHEFQTHLDKLEKEWNVIPHFLGIVKPTGELIVTI